jgi:hypothetical protein
MRSKNETWKGATEVSKLPGDVYLIQPHVIQRRSIKPCQ